MTRDEIGYALSKQVPAMRHEVTLHTTYGELTLDGRDAERVAALVQRLLEARLNCVGADAGQWRGDRARTANSPR